MNTVQLSLRQLARSPGFSAVAILTLALGIGLSTSSFSLANAFLLRNVPYPEADRLVRIFGTSRQFDRQSHAPGNIIDVRTRVTSYAGFALYNGDNYSWGESGQPAEQVSGMAATADFFEVLGVQPWLGRGFLPGEDQPEKPAVIVLTHRAWMRRYAGDAQVLGRTARINMRNHTIVGVLPAKFDAPIVWGPVEFVMPRTMEVEFPSQRTGGWMQAVARLKPETTLRQAQAELETIAAQLQQAWPKENEGHGLRVVGLAQSNMDGVSRSLLWLMTGLAVAMLLIACANLASLQVARALVRSREFAVRAALGGNQRQLMGPLLVESLLLAFAGGVGGLFVASWANDVVSSFLLINGEPGYRIPIDANVLAFASFSSLLSGVAFGLAPAWLASRAPAAEALKEGSRSATGTPSHQRLKRFLIVGELAVAMTLVGIAAAFGFGTKSFVRREVGWNMDRLFIGFLALPYSPYGAGTETQEFYRALLPKLQAIPGVEHAALARQLPLFALGTTMPFQIEGRPVEDRMRRPQTQVGPVTAEFFAALEIPLLAGRIFSRDITEKDPAVALINETFARQHWPGENPVGRRVRLGEGEKWVEIIGVVRDIGMPMRLTTPETRLQLYQPLAQSATRYFGLVLKTSVPPDVVTKTVREAVASIDPDLPVAAPGALQALVDRNLANFDLVIVNLGVSAGMGLLIAAVGLFGVISQLTAQRTRDIGVRMALGAGRSDILRMILGEGVRLLVVGIAVGVPAYYALAFVLHRALPEMKLPGLWLLVANVVVLGGTALVACYFPAQRATQVNPIEALRAE